MKAGHVTDFQIDKLDVPESRSDKGLVLDGMQDYSEKVRTIVHSSNGEVIGGIEVYRTGTVNKHHFYTKSLAYQSSERFAGVQTFAIIEYIKMFCQEGEEFDFLGSREHSIAKFFRGFGSMVNNTLEVRW